MDGGLGAGELGVVVAPAGIGKSWCLQTIGSAAVREGLNVVHYTLELNENYVGLRYDTVFSGITTSDIQFYQDDVKKKIDELKGTLLIKYFPTKSASVQTLASHLSQIEIQHQKPDLLIVDYADILKGVGTEKRHVLENIYEDLRVIKNRFGPDGITFPSSINTNIGKIDVYEANTQDGQATQGKMDNSQEYLRKQLANKYNNSQKDTGGFE